MWETSSISSPFSDFIPSPDQLLSVSFLSTDVKISTNLRTEHHPMNKQHGHHGNNTCFPGIRVYLIVSVMVSSFLIFF